MNRLQTLLFVIALSAARVCFGDVLTDDEIRQDIVEYLVPRCGGGDANANDPPMSELAAVVAINGDTNRLARILAEIAQTNNAWYSEMAMWQLEKYGTAAQLPFLYSCATNPVVGGRAVKSILRIEGVTSNSVAAAESFFNVANHDDSLETTRLCLNLMAQAMAEGVDPICSSNALHAAYNFSVGENCHYYCFDRGRIVNDSSYRYSKRRLAYLRQVSLRGDLFEFQLNYVTNAINELVAYPESALPE